MSSTPPEDAAKPAARKRVRKPAAKAAATAAAPKPAKPKSAKPKSAKPKSTRPKSTRPAPAKAEATAAVPPAGDTAPRRVGGGWLAVGVGSAALVAALLFATRGKRNDWSK